MIYTAREYSLIFKFKDKYVSCATIKRRCMTGMLPKNHVAKKLLGKTGAWVIEVKDSL
jgi:hypothetical protein